MEPGDGPTSGVLETVRQTLNTVLAIARNRVELLAVETREEARRWLEAFLLAAALAALATLTVAMVSLTIVITCWEEHRLTGLVGLSVFYMLTTFIVGWRLQRRLHNWPAFSATIGELKKDKANLEKSHEPPASAQASPDSGK